MKGDADVIEVLNDVLCAELTGINQYFIHSEMCENWRYKRLSEHSRKESIEEMKHADHIIKRILLLEGLPNLQDLGKLLIGETVPEMLKSDLKLEYGARTDMVAAIAHFESVKDFVSRDLVSSILDDTEKHIDFLETELELVQKVGLQNYLQTQIGEGPSSS